MQDMKRRMQQLEEQKQQVDEQKQQLESTIRQPIVVRHDLQVGEFTNSQLETLERFEQLDWSHYLTRTPEVLNIGSMQPIE